MSEALEQSRLLSFYDRLRARVADTVRKRGGRVGDKSAEALLLVPDVFMMLARLAMDRSVPAESRRLIGGGLLYFILPLDLFPEAFTGPVGYLDDLVIACAILGAAFSKDLEAQASRYWSGSRELGSVLRDVSRAADGLLGADVSARVQRLLARRGVSSSSSR